MESINVVIDDIPEDMEEEDEVSPQETDVPTQESVIVPETANSDDLQINRGPSIWVQKDHPLENIIGNLNEWVVAKSKESIANSFFISKIE